MASENRTIILNDQMLDRSISRRCIVPQIASSTFARFIVVNASSATQESAIEFSLQWWYTELASISTISRSRWSAVVGVRYLTKLHGSFSLVILQGM